MAGIVRVEGTFRVYTVKRAVTLTVVNAKQKCSLANGESVKQNGMFCSKAKKLR